MKYKKHISIFLIFIVCTTFIYLPKKAQAFDLVVTPTILWTLGTLVLATGVVALNQEQVLHMGQSVFDGIKANNYEIDAFDVVNGVVKGVNIYGKVLDVVSSVASSLPKKNVNYDSDVSNFNNLLTVDTSLFPKSRDYDTEVSVYSFSIANNKNTFIKINDVARKLNVNAIKYTVLLYRNSVYDTKIVSILGTFASGGLDYTTQWAIGNKDSFDIEIETDSEVIGLKKHTSIPYDNPLVSKGLNLETFPLNLPYTGEKQGYLPVPSVIPMDIPITTDIPLTWDNVKDKVTSLPLDDTTDIPGVGENDLPGDTTLPSELSLWEWLKNLLNSILNAIKSILAFLTSFLTNLLNGIKDLLLSLFIPSDTYFTDTFYKLKNQFSNKLSYKSYSDLFDRQYAASGIKDVTINWQGQTLVIVKFSEYTKFMSFVNSVAYAFFFFLLAMYNYNQIYKLIRGTDLVGSGNTIGHMHGQLSASEELRINNMEKSFKKLGR